MGISRIDTCHYRGFKSHMLLLVVALGVLFLGADGATEVPAGVIQGTGHTVGFGELKVEQNHSL